MTSRTQIRLDIQTSRRTRQRARELGVSLAEYVRRLVVRDLSSPQAKVDVSRVFDLGDSSGSEVSKDKDRMIADAFHFAPRKFRRR